MHSVLRKYLSVCVGDGEDEKEVQHSNRQQSTGTPALLYGTTAQLSFPSTQMMNTILPSSELPTKEQ